MKDKTAKKHLINVLSIAFWLVVWQLAASAANRGLMLKIPLPVETLFAFAENCTQGSFWLSVGASVLHIVCGFTSAVVIGAVCALLSARIPLFRALSAPIMHLVRSVPVAAFIIIAWLWVPSRILPSFISCLMVMPIIWSHVDAALGSLDDRLVEMAAVFGMKRSEILFKVKLPNFKALLLTIKSIKSFLYCSIKSIISVWCFFFYWQRKNYNTENSRNNKFVPIK